jgi:hypothetical protein
MTDLSWRRIQKSDIEACLGIQPRNWGNEIVGQEVARRVWGALIDHYAFDGVVIESVAPAARRRIVACGARVFVAAEFMNEEITYPQSGLNARIIAGLSGGQPLLLEPHDVGKANAGEGIDLVVLSGSWIDGLLPAEVGDINRVLGETFIEAHRGYKLNRILREDSSPGEIEVTRGIFQCLASFPEPQCVINLFTRADAFTIPYSMTNTMFHYQPPRMKLRDAQQQLLLAALNGETDQQLGDGLGLSVSAVKKRWSEIYERVSRAMPDLLTQTESLVGGARGRQKKHLVLAYVREHLEEVRPYQYVPSVRLRKQHRVAGF